MELCHPFTKRVYILSVMRETWMRFLRLAFNIVSAHSCEENVPKGGDKYKGGSVLCMDNIVLWQKRILLKLHNLRLFRNV